MEEQLRLRVSADQRKKLDRLAQERGRNETMSDVLRELISSADESGKLPLKLASETRQIIERLSLETNRPVDHVITECVLGIWDLIETDQAPLIVEEVKLRRKYKKKPSTSQSVIKRKRAH